MTYEQWVEVLNTPSVLVLLFLFTFWLTYTGLAIYHKLKGKK